MPGRRLRETPSDHARRSRRVGGAGERARPRSARVAWMAVDPELPARSGRHGGRGQQKARSGAPIGSRRDAQRAGRRPRTASRPGTRGASAARRRSP